MISPYTYRIGWTEYDKHYYGVRYANRLLPAEDLWHEYFTSSKYVSEMREKVGEPDIIQVRKIFDNIDHAIIWEELVLTRLNVLEDDRWLNQNISGCVNNQLYKGLSYYDRYPKAIADQLRTQLSLNRQNKTYTELFGSTIARDLIQKASDRRQGKTYEELFGNQEANRLKRLRRDRVGMKAPNFGNQHTSKTIQLIKDKTIGIKKEQVSCIHCKKVGGKPAMKRWHFDNCKLKEKEIGRNP